MYNVSLLLKCESYSSILKGYFTLTKVSLVMQYETGYN